MSSSFSNMVGDVSWRITAECMGRMPYFSLRCACSLGRRHDSKTESSRGVTARREKPRTLLLLRFQRTRTASETPARTKVPKTEPRIM